MARSSSPQLFSGECLQLPSSQHPKSSGEGSAPAPAPSRGSAEATSGAQGFAQFGLGKLRDGEEAQPLCAPRSASGREQPSWGRAFCHTQPEISPARVHVCCQLVRGLSAPIGPGRVKVKALTSVCFAFSSFLPFNWILCLRCSIHTSGSWLIHVLIHFKIPLVLQTLTRNGK